jgi:hypothetical protein
MSLGKAISERRQKQARVIEVPEWGDDDAPLLMYVFPITAGDMNKIQKKHKNFVNDATIDGMIDLIILKACDADGNRLFTLEDKVHLMNEPVEVISQIGANMFGDVETIEDAEKN